MRLFCLLFYFIEGGRKPSSMECFRRVFVKEGMDVDINIDSYPSSDFGVLKAVIKSSFWDTTFFQLHSYFILDNAYLE